MSQNIREVHHHHYHNGAGPTGAGGYSDQQQYGNTNAQPTAGEKMSGKFEQLTGKMTNNPQKIQEGELKQGEIPSQQPGYGNTSHQGHGYSQEYGNTTHHGHHTGRDGALGGAAGGFAGHEGHHGHTGRDAALGTAAGAGVAHHQQQHGSSNQPTAGEKISGKFDEFAGKMTNNPQRVAEGEAKQGEYPTGQTYGQQHGTHTGRDAALGGGAGGLAGHEGHHGHTGRDAALGTAVGAGIGHHEQHHSGHTGLGHQHSNNTSTTTGNGLTHHSQGTAVGAGAGNYGGYGNEHGPGGVTGTESRSQAATGKPSLADKISGSIDVMVGKMEKDPQKIQEGQLKKEGGLAQQGANRY